MRKVALTTFGCKANQFDTAVIESLLRRELAAIVDFSQKADFYVINSCAITAEADREARQFVRRARKTNPSAKIIVTGCSAQVNPEMFRSIGADCVVGNEGKGRVVELITDQRPETRDHRSELRNLGTWELKRLGKKNPKLPGSQALKLLRNRSHVSGLMSQVSGNYFFGIPDVYPHNSRAFLKIQDGCSQFCSFCIVPFARGLNRSVPSDTVLESMHQLLQKGFNEIVLTGIHLGTYGHDLKPRSSLYELLKRIDRGLPAPRVRISSVDPEELSDEMIDLIAGSDIFCHHLHLPLQSGDDGILKKMRRRYTAGHFARLAEKLARKMPQACLGTDLIVGFPGEGDGEFETTRRLLEELPLHYIHTFPYSDRKGTKASGFTDKVKPSVIRARARQIRELSARKKEAFHRCFVGQTLEAVVESRRGEQSVGLTRNYISVEIGNECHYPQRSLAPVRIDSVCSEAVVGSVIARSPDVRRDDEAISLTQ